MATLVDRSARGSFLFPERGVLLRRPYAVMAAAGIALGVTLAMSSIGQRLEWAHYDQSLRRLAAYDVAPAPDIVVVAIDDPSFSEVALPWPWPRSLHAALVDQLVEGGARTIAFDVVFDTPSTAEADEALATAIARAGNVILAADRAVIEDRAYAVEQWIEPHPRFAADAAAVGITRIPRDDDFVLRRALLQHEGRPSLALAVASQVPGFALPTGVDPMTPHLFRFNGPSRRGITTVSYYQALDAARLLPPGIFKNKHVLIGLALGAAARDTPDQFPTPVAAAMPGVEIHATIIDALLRRRFVGEPFGSQPRVASLCIAIALPLTALLFVSSPIAGAAVIVGVSVAVLVTGYAALAGGRYLPAVAPIVTIAFAYAWTAGYRFALVTRERRMIRRAFQHYVAPAIVDKMLNDPAQLKLGGEQYEVSVLFSDLEGFTTFAERASPPQLSAHLSQYFQEMLDVMLPHHGTLDKLIGDSIMMYFGCPLPDPDHAVNACRAALAMQQRTAVLNDRWSQHGLPTLRTRVGINTGDVVAGNMGTTGIFNFTVIGDAVNLASRLEGANKEYGTLIIVGEDTWRRVDDSFEGRELDAVRVKGKSQAVAIYELAAAHGQLDPRRRAVFAEFAEGLALYRAGQWNKAAARFARALELDATDGPSRTFAARCAVLLRQPPAEWDPIYTIGGSQG